MRKLSKNPRRKSSLLCENLGGETILDPLHGIDIYLSPQNAARYLNVSVKFIYERIQSGEIKCQSIGGRIKRIKKGVLDEWLSAQQGR
jgi:excisionase family DNA binding protein